MSSLRVLTTDLLELLGGLLARSLCPLGRRHPLLEVVFGIVGICIVLSPVLPAFSCYVLLAIRRGTPLRGRRPGDDWAEYLLVTLLGLQDALLRGAPRFEDLATRLECGRCLRLVGTRA